LDVDEYRLGDGQHGAGYQLAKLSADVISLSRP
jgi:hypothetical protein